MKTSVAMCTYNGEKFIEQQLDSILNQTVSVNEIIICDDGSTDNTIKIINQYIEKYPSIIKLYVNHENLKSVKNFEKAISLCQNEIIFLADQDDVWVEDKIKIILNFFSNNHNINCIASSGSCIDENNKILAIFPIWDVFENMNNNENINYFNTLVICGNFATGATMAFRNTFVKEIVPFPAYKNFHHDEWILFKSSIDNNFKFLSDKLINYRIHSNQQVGSIANNINIKNRIIEYFDVKKENVSFINLKKRIKNIIKTIDNKPEEYQKSYKILNKQSLLELLQEQYNILKKTHPVKFQLIKIIDKITGKRQLKK